MLYTGIVTRCSRSQISGGRSLPATFSSCAGVTPKRVAARTTPISPLASNRQEVD
jgi:hypothetical protein